MLRGSVGFSLLLAGSAAAPVDAGGVVKEQRQEKAAVVVVERPQPRGQGRQPARPRRGNLGNTVSTLTVNLMSLSLGINLTVVFDNGAVARRTAYTNYDVATASQPGLEVPVSAEEPTTCFESLT